MKKINIAITGGLGKMGQKIINSSKNLSVWCVNPPPPIDIIFFSTISI